MSYNVTVEEGKASARRAGREDQMKYLPIIVDELDRTYSNVTYNSLGAAMDALEEFKQNFSETRDNKIVEAYVLNVVTGKHIAQ